MNEGTETIFIVDEQGATFWSRERGGAEARLLAEAWDGAVHLTITKAEAPVGMTDDQLDDWACMHASDPGCDQ